MDVTPRLYKALDLSELKADHFIRTANGKSLCFNRLPTVAIDLRAQSIEHIAVLSWRWDIDKRTNSSRNAYVACQEAIRQAVGYLLLDKVTINQEQTDEEMLPERLAFSQLYGEVPVIAAYDDPNIRLREVTAEVHGEDVTLGSPLSRIMRRPWICHEVQLYRSNPTTISYVGHVPGLGCDGSPDFRRMAESIWESTFSQTVLYTLAGVVGMHHVEDFRYILPRFFDLLSKAHSTMSTNDYLLTTAILTGDVDSDYANCRINNDHSLENIPFDQYRVGPGYAPEDMPRTQDYYTRFDICLGDDRVAQWLTRHKFYPFPDLRVWFQIATNAENLIRAQLGVEQSASVKHDASQPSDDPELPEPEVSVVFHERDLLG